MKTRSARAKIAKEDRIDEKPAPGFQPRRRVRPDLFACGKQKTTSRFRFYFFFRRGGQSTEYENSTRSHIRYREKYDSADLRCLLTIERATDHQHPASHRAYSTERTLVDYLTRTRARPVTWPPIAKDVCGTAKSVRGGRSVEKERIERRDRVIEKEGEDRTEEEILDRGYRLGSRDRRCSSSTCP
ncbi:uncharacterized protein LOC105834213 isoform X2 [Monomorium pharaonis]|uniref:uncharacterized protein LOC105834213 isoform X2 n=1 Tax=Monomorium pharaonis TaxID=307658 RepID=UPI0017471073|nr:uncharacterized protein LOC105834213 isoform X2 [Monomorium pharaonis]